MKDAMTSLCIHASCVAIDGRGVLLAGASGAGKSDLALRLIDGGGKLVADDQVQLHVEDGRLVASPPSQLEGLLEIRFAGLIRLPFEKNVPIELVIDLVPDGEGLDRLPLPRTVSFLDCPLNCLKLPGAAASTPAIIRAVLCHGLIEIEPTAGG